MTVQKGGWDYFQDQNEGSNADVVTATSGTHKLWTLGANFAAGSGDAATEHISDATGWKSFSVDIVDDVAIAANEALMVAWSTTVNDEANLTTQLNALRTALGTPDAAAHTNCLIVTERTSPMPVVFFDGQNRIKTISVATQGTADKDIIVSTVE